MVVESRMGLIELHQLGLRLGQRLDRKGKILTPGTPVFRDVSWTIPEGDRLGLVGHAGCGKTSLLRLLNRLIDPTEGRLLWQGKPYDEVAVSYLRQNILYVAQEPKLLGMTVEASIAYPLQLRDMEPSQLKTRVDYWCDRFELSQELLQKNEVELSLGQKQWVSIARALAIEPSVLLLDEPTASLDPWQCDRLRAILDQLPKTTLIIASHQTDWLQNLCDRALVIHQQRATESADWLAIQQELQSSMPSPNDEWD